MSDALEKIASSLATMAVTREQTTGHIKAAAGLGDYLSVDKLKEFASSPSGKYLLGGVGGAGLGALVGAMQPRRKGRNALYYGAMGGLGGLGLAHLWNQYGGQPGMPPAAQAAQSAARGVAGATAPEKNPNVPDGKKTLVRPEAPSLLNSQARRAEQLRAQVAGAGGPERVLTDTMPDIGPDSRLSDYENWKLNPKWHAPKSWGETFWPGNWMRSDELRDANLAARFAKERAALKQEIVDSAKIPFKSRPTLRQIRQKYNLPGEHGFETVNPLMQYKDYDLSNPDTLDIIRRARAAGFADDIDGYMRRLQENSERLGDATTGFM